MQAGQHQRSPWGLRLSAIAVLLFLVIKGAGPLSLDRALARRMAPAAQPA